LGATLDGAILDENGFDPAGGSWNG
jgi:hypothetical protein